MQSLNPYIAGNPVGGTPNFVGRADVLREVLRVMRQPHQNIIVLYGQRRIGKTSVLQQLSAQLPNEGNYYPVYFDLQDKATWSLGRVLTELARVLSYELVRQGPPSMKQTGPLLSDVDPVKAFQETWLPATLNRLPEGHSIVLLFDEFDVLADPKGGQAGADLFPYLRGLLATDPDRLQFTFVIGRKVEDLESIALSLFKGAPSLRVSLLNKADTIELMRLSERNESLKWSSEATEKVWDLTHGHPFLTQQLCSRLWENLYDSDPTGIPTVLPDDVENAISETLEASRNTLEWLWDGLPPAERVVISALAGAGDRSITQPQLEQLLRESGVRVVIRELQNAPQLLRDWDLIEPAEDGYRFRVELFRRWILEHKPLSRVQEELDRIEPLAENLYQAAYGFFRSNQLEDALPLLRQAIGLNPNHARSRQLLAEIFLLRGEVDQAVQILQLLYDTQPSIARPRLVQALLLKTEEEPDEEKRLAIYQQILMVDPTHPVVTQRVADIQKTARQQELAEQLTSLRSLEAEKRYREALELARKLAETYPDDRDWPPDLDRLERKTKLADDYQRAIGALNSGDKETALRGLADVIALEPDYEEATRYLHLAKTGQDATQLASQLSGEQKSHSRVKAKLDEETLSRTEVEKQRSELQIRLENAEKHGTSRLRSSYRNFIWGIIGTLLAISFFLAWMWRGFANEANLALVEATLAQYETSLTQLSAETPIIDTATELSTEPVTAEKTEPPAETPTITDTLPADTPLPDSTPTPEPTSIPTPDPFAGPIPENARARLGKGEVFAMALSPNEDLLAVAASTGIFVYRADSFEFSWNVPTDFRVRSVAFSPDGKLAAGLEDGTIIVWDAQDGSEIQTTTDHKDSVYSLAFSPDGQWAASGSADGVMYLWNASDGTINRRLEGHAHGVFSLAFSTDSTTLASGGDENTLIVWDLTFEKDPQFFLPAPADVWGVAWSPSGILASASDDGAVLIWNLDTREPSPLFGHDGPVKSVAWSSNEQLISGGNDGNLILWNLESSELKQTLTGGNGLILNVAWDLNGNPISASSDTITRWDLNSGEVGETLIGFTGPVNSVAFSPDGFTLASGGADGIVRLWDTGTGGQIRTFSGHFAAVTSVAFSPDGLTLASGSWDNTIILWDVQTGEQKGNPIAHDAPIFSVAFSPADGSLLAFGAQDTRVILWNLSAEGERLSFEGHESAVNAIAFSSNGAKLASGAEDGTVIIWDAGTGFRLHTFNESSGGHTDPVFSVAFSPATDTFLASGSADNTIILWNVADDAIGDTLNGNSTVFSVAFSPVGLLATGSQDGAVSLWQLADLTSREPQTMLFGHHDTVNSLGFSPNGETLASASSDGTIVLWDMSIIAP